MRLLFECLQRFVRNEGKCFEFLSLSSFESWRGIMIGVRTLVTADLIDLGDKLAISRIPRVVGRTLPQPQLLLVRILPCLRLLLCLLRRPLLRGLRRRWVAQRCLSLIRGHP